ncbi:MAG: chorismate mutase [Candidatus Latescibacteria bacterium]|mgnify:CR=1 FL=1|jgi:chorismate mutase|nr:chorismate mutase [Candidatus Latescibacterota bacterium]
MVRGIRGAITVESNRKADIRSATEDLLSNIVESNNLQLDDIASVFFTGTSDLDEEVPARAARNMGWTAIPMFCSQEMAVKDGLALCIRVMIHVNTNKQQTEINHVYLGDAIRLRPDLTQGG